MDKETLSNYGWIVICVLVLAVMLAFATPFGQFIATAVQSTTQGLFDTNQKALQSANINIMQQEFETMLNGNNGVTVPNGFTYIDSATEEVLCAGQQLPSTMYAGSQLIQAEGDYIYTLMKDGYETLEEAHTYYKVYAQNQTGMTWEEYVQSSGATEEMIWELYSGIFGIGLTEDTFTPTTNPTCYWSVAVKDRTKTTYGVICNELLDYQVADAGATFWNCTSLITAPSIPGYIKKTAGTFNTCTSLVEAEITHGISIIGNSTFNSCESLKTVTLPDSVTVIEDMAFDNCSKLNSIVYKGTISQWNAIELYVDETDPYCNWNARCGEITVTCIDGTIVIPAWSN